MGTNQMCRFGNHNWAPPTILSIVSRMATTTWMCALTCRGSQRQWRKISFSISVARSPGHIANVLFTSLRYISARGDSCTRHLPCIGISFSTIMIPTIPWYHKMPVFFTGPLSYRLFSANSFIIYIVEQWSVTIFLVGQVKYPYMASGKERNCILMSMYAHIYEALLIWRCAWEYQEMSDIDIWQGKNWSLGGHVCPYIWSFAILPQILQCLHGA